MERLDGSRGAPPKVGTHRIRPPGPRDQAAKQLPTMVGIRVGLALLPYMAWSPNPQGDFENSLPFTGVHKMQYVLQTAAVLPTVLSEGALVVATNPLVAVPLLAGTAVVALSSNRPTSEQDLALISLLNDNRKRPASTSIQQGIRKQLRQQLEKRQSMSDNTPVSKRTRGSVRAPQISPQAPTNQRPTPVYQIAKWRTSVLTGRRRHRRGAARRWRRQW